MSYYLTDPENNSIDRGGMSHWPHKEDTVRELMILGAPLRVAELAVIDYRRSLYTCQQNKLTPFQAARMLFEIIEPKYKTEDGEWMFAT